MVCVKVVFIILICHPFAFCAFDWLRNRVDGAAKVRENVKMFFTPDVHSAVYFPLKDLPFLRLHPSFNLSRPTVFYVHGWWESGEFDLSVVAVRGAYVDRDDHNVVSVDWSEYSKNINYHTNVIPQMVVIAEVLAEELMSLVRQGYGIENIHLVGHSLGGQMVGKIGRHLKKKSNGTLVIPRIYALDPAGPGFEDNFRKDFEPINPRDATHVQVIHTCGGVLGMKHRVGTIDFFPNGGEKQVGCDVDATATVIESFQMLCDHARSWHFYQATVRNPKGFPAIRCNSWEDFLRNATCYKNDIEYMGFGANMTNTGKYFLQTHGNMFNLSMGMDGIRPSKVHFSRLMSPTEPSNYVEVPADIANMLMF